MDTRQVGQATIHIIQGDITQLSGIDAIVNAAKESLLGGDGIDGAVHEAAGPQLKEYCEKEIPQVSQDVRCPTGQARITPSFNLAPRIKHIIHTVGPRGDNTQRKALLESAYRSCLVLADQDPQLDIKSIVTTKLL